LEKHKNLENTNNKQIYKKQKTKKNNKKTKKKEKNKFV
jgi:hypothetical protein